MIEKRDRMKPVNSLDAAAKEIDLCITKINQLVEAVNECTKKLNALTDFVNKKFDSVK